MYICNDKKFVFIHSPKCAGTTVSVYLKYMKENPGQMLDPLPLEHHMTYDTFLKNNPAMKDYYSFAFVRNPWDRVVSAFYDYSLLERNEVDEYRKTTTNDEGVVVKQELSISFEEFVLNHLTSILESEPKDHTIHYFPCSFFLKSEIKEIDFVGRVETFEEDWKQIREHLSLPESNCKEAGIIEWQHMRKNEKTKPRSNNYYSKRIIQEWYGKKYRGHYTPQSRKVVQDLYHKDIENYNYEF